jgi:hypothetical protein
MDRADMMPQANLCAGADQAQARKWALFEKSAAKTFIYAESEALNRHGPRVTKFFCYFLFTKSSLPS